ncbi:alpha-L-rhamnosidase [Solimonas sp. K1W22B-7]|uniref:alpha-L-rhamnosidase n=1 Tax=Solimonas sp. K1W22B-7 TaxID=2303331 RepID=UPI000E32FD99|nr:alpha-L-rhamnosidase [Solimonas sp. K1W22B-7]AXQ30579.1 alpha-L-rhamnosidase [Solimonas sp. K1W22B-7]
MNIIMKAAYARIPVLTLLLALGACGGRSEPVGVGSPTVPQPPSTKACAAAGGGVSLTELRTEAQREPLGLDARQPRFSWQLQSGKRCVSQTAYELKLGTRPGAADVWSSGKVDSADPFADYAGPPLQSRGRYWWTVRVYDQAGQAAAMPAPAAFEMGLLDLSDWSAKLIGAAPPPEGSWTRDRDLRLAITRRVNFLAYLPSVLVGVTGHSTPPITESIANQPSPYLRKEFELRGPVVRARLYATALGVYNLRLNGRRVSDDELSPGWTDYFKHLQYRSYDVTAQLNSGVNVLAAVLGAGWYAGHVGFGGPFPYGDKPSFAAQLELSYADGSSETIVSDASWRMSMDGPVRASDLLMGEDYDASREMPGWDQPGYAPAASWGAVRASPLSALTDVGIVALQGPPVRVTERRRPVDVRQLPNGDWRFDLGQNMVGIVEIKLDEAAGTKLTLRHGEGLNKDDSVWMDNLRGAQASDTYIAGGGAVTWRPSFTFHGFRYVQVKGLTRTPDADSLTGLVLGTDVPRSGVVTTDNELINRILLAVDWGLRGNYLSIPTDTPARDERLGWTGDSQIFARAATYQREVLPFLRKHLMDVRDTQRADGAIADVAPMLSDFDGVWIYYGTSGWGDVIALIPWELYRAYGDRRVIDENWEAMTSWIDYCAAAAQGYLRDGNGYGDHLAIDAPDKALINTAYFAHTADLLAQMARATGRTADEKKYSELFGNIRQAFTKAYVREDGTVKGDTQSGYVVALAFGLVPEAQRPQLLERLFAKVEEADRHLSTGFMTTRFLLPLLVEGGRADLAHAILNQTTYPSWGNILTEKGGTTFFETWSGSDPKHDTSGGAPLLNSLNHYSHGGSVGEWIWSQLAGISANQPGFAEVRIRPVPGEGTTQVEGVLQSVRGQIVSAWKQRDDGFDLDVALPANTTGLVYIPGSDPSAVAETGQGTHRPAQAAEGVRYLGTEGDRLVYRVGSGSYRFRSGKAAGDSEEQFGGGAISPLLLGLWLLLVVLAHRRPLRGPSRNPPAQVRPGTGTPGPLRRSGGFHRAIGALDR